MAESQEELIVKFSAQGASDLSAELKRIADGMEKVDQKGKSTARGGFLDLESNRRVRRQLGGLAQDLLSVQDPASAANLAILRLSETLKVGLGVGIAASVGVALVQKLGQAADSAAKFRSEIDSIRRTSNVGGSDFLGVDEVNKQLDAAASKLNEIRDRQTRERVGTFGGLEKFGRQSLASVLGYGSFSEQDQQEARDKTTAQKSASDAVDKLSQKTRALNAVDFIKVKQGEFAARYLKEEIQHRERLGELARSAAAAGVTNTGATHAENQRNKNANALIGYEKAEFENRIDQEQRLARVQELRSKGGLSSSQSALYSSKLELANARDLLRNYEKIGDVDKTRAQRAVVSRAETGLRDLEFSQYQEARADPSGFLLRRQKETTDRKNFEQGRADYFDRIKRGAYGQSGYEAELFGTQNNPKEQQDDSQADAGDLLDAINGLRGDMAAYWK